MIGIVIATTFGAAWGVITLILCAVLGTTFLILAYWLHKKQEEKITKAFIAEAVLGVIGGFLILFSCVFPAW